MGGGFLIVFITDPFLSNFNSAGIFVRFCFLTALKGSHLMKTQIFGLLLVVLVFLFLIRPGVYS